MSKNSIIRFEIDDFINVNNGFVAFKTENQKHNSSKENLPHSHNFYCVSFLFDGKVRHSSDLENHLIVAPAVLFIGKNQVHIHSTNEDNKMLNLCFSEDFLTRNNSSFVENEWDELSKIVFLPLTQTESDEIGDYFKLALNEFVKKPGIKNNLILGNILSILFCLFESIILHKKLANNTGESSGIISEFKKHVREDFRKEISVNFYANKLNITASLLNKIIKEQCGLTPKQVISELRLTEAKRLLFWTQKTVKEIAFELGFESDSYFNRFFKKQTGLTPIEFQKINRNSQK